GSAGCVSAGWSGACAGSGSCTLTMSQARSVNATFTLKSSAPVCIVPKLKGKTLKAARGALTKAHCQAGKVTKKFSTVKKGRVISQRPKAGKDLPAGSKINLAVSKGKKPYAGVPRGRVRHTRGRGRGRRLAPCCVGCGDAYANPVLGVVLRELVRRVRGVADTGTRAADAVAAEPLVAIGRREVRPGTAARGHLL